MQRRPGSKSDGTRSGEVEVLDGTVERLTFVSQSDAWSVVRIVPAVGGEVVTAVGNLLGAKAGEAVRLWGTWVVDRKYGRQFRVDSYVTLVPGTLEGIQKYLGSGLVRGLGKVLAQRLVDHFGADTLKVIEQQPERLHEVEGIGPARIEELKRAWSEQREIKEVMLFLQSYSVSTHHAVKIFKRYGGRAIAVVKENPYRLAGEIFGIGFKTADRIAASMGLAHDAPERAQAGVLHVMAELVDEGHTCAPRGVVMERASVLLGLGVERLEPAVDALGRDGELVALPGEDGEPMLATRPISDAEDQLARGLWRLAGGSLSHSALDAAGALEWFEVTSGLSLAESQREAIAQALRSKVFVLTGGPGTGKTTILKAIVRIFERLGQRCVLAAPTGRAAKRMSEATGREAKTLHRLLEWNPRRMSFERTSECPLEADLVVVDEASMIDTVLGSCLVGATPAAARLVLVGDVDQLPSVGPGSVLSDVIRSECVAVVRLSKVFRQAESSLIVRNAHRINRGELPVLEAEGAERDFFFIERAEPDGALDTVKELLAERIPRKFGFDPAHDVQVLCPMNRGMLGAHQLNLELQALLNPNGTSIQRGHRTFRTGDKVMQVRNNYDLDVYNGDIGCVAELDPATRTAVVEFDGRRVVFDEDDLDELALAYACTIHKSQGSEYPCVIIPLHTQHFVMLKRNLIYTAITRGRKLVVIVGSRRALGLATKSEAADVRFTQLRKRLVSLARPGPT